MTLFSTARKIAVTALIHDEDLSDFSAFLPTSGNELARLVIDAENAELPKGDGTGQHVLGLLNQAGILTRPVGTDTPLDAVEQAFNDLRVGPAFVAPTVFVAHPNDFSGLRRTKDGQQRNLLNADPERGRSVDPAGDPGGADHPDHRGNGGRDERRGGGSAMGPAGDHDPDGLRGNGIRDEPDPVPREERIGLGVPRPAAVIKVTGL